MKHDNRPDAAPNLARARNAGALIRARGFGVLATVSTRMPGYPFASIVNYALDHEARPVFLLSSLAVHTKNLAGNAKASLFVFERETEADPFASARMNLMGEVRRVPEHEAATARELYTRRHPGSAQYVEFADFSLYRLTVQDVYYIGGFGEMGWVSPQDYAAAQKAT